jgi:hypothetical protein
MKKRYGSLVLRRRRQVQVPPSAPIFSLDLSLKAKETETNFAKLDMEKQYGKPGFWQGRDIKNAPER